MPLSLLGQEISVDLMRVGEGKCHTLAREGSACWIEARSRKITNMWKNSNFKREITSTGELAIESLISTSSYSTTNLATLATFRFAHQLSGSNSNEKNRKLNHMGPRSAVNSLLLTHHRVSDQCSWHSKPNPGNSVVRKAAPPRCCSVGNGIPRFACHSG